MRSACTRSDTAVAADPVLAGEDAADALHQQLRGRGLQHHARPRRAAGPARSRPSGWRRSAGSSAPASVAARQLARARPCPRGPGRHGEVEQQDVRMERARQPHRLVAVAGFADDLEPRLRVENALQASRKIGWSSAVTMRIGRSGCGIRVDRIRPLPARSSPCLYPVPGSTADVPGDSRHRPAVEAGRQLWRRERAIMPCSGAFGNTRPHSERLGGRPGTPRVQAVADRRERSGSADDRRGEARRAPGGACGRHRPDDAAATDDPGREPARGSTKQNLERRFHGQEMLRPEEHAGAADVLDAPGMPAASSRRSGSGRSRGQGIVVRAERRVVRPSAGGCVVMECSVVCTFGPSRGGDAPAPRLPDPLTLQRREHTAHYPARHK